MKNKGSFKLISQYELAIGKGVKVEFSICKDGRIVVSGKKYGRW